MLLVLVVPISYLSGCYHLRSFRCWARLHCCEVHGMGYNLIGSSHGHYLTGRSLANWIIFCCASLGLCDGSLPAHSLWHPLRCQGWLGRAAVNLSPCAACTMKGSLSTTCACVDSCYLWELHRAAAGCMAGRCLLLKAAINSQLKNRSALHLMSPRVHLPSCCLQGQKLPASNPGGMLHIELHPASPAGVAVQAAAKRILMGVLVQYQPSGLVARKLQMQPRTLGRVTGGLREPW